MGRIGTCPERMKPGWSASRSGRRALAPGRIPCELPPAVPGYPAAPLLHWMMTAEEASLGSRRPEFPGEVGAGGTASHDGSRPAARLLELTN
jgi:hypothetical protein